MKLLQFLSIIFLGLLLNTCISPFNAEAPYEVEGLVVSGTLTTVTGLQEVVIRRPASFTTASINYGVKDAQVWILDNTGKRADFVPDQVNAGFYFPADQQFVAEKGKTYVLHVLTQDQSKYESAPETVKPVAPIKNVYTEEVITNDPGLGKVLSGYKVLLDAEDPATKGDYYRWSWKHFEPISFCKEVYFLPPRARVASVTAFTCCELPCWDIDRCYRNCTDVMSDVLINGKSISRHPILSIGYCSNDYYVEVQQRSITKDAYDYWRAVDQLSANNGSIFDVAPAAIRGNLKCINDAKKTAFGFFEVSDVQEKGFFINRSEVKNRAVLQRCPPFPATIEPFICAPCLESAYRTKVKPKFWTK
jgi:hypothetical protein